MKRPAFGCQLYHQLALRQCVFSPAMTVHFLNTKFSFFFETNPLVSSQLSLAEKCTPTGG
jgi:hypothetical protein